MQFAMYCVEHLHLLVSFILNLVQELLCLISQFAARLLWFGTSLDSFRLVLDRSQPNVAVDGFVRKRFDPVVCGNV